ncbi:MAG: hypothetical protein ACWA5P_13685 [bacterium]
MKHFILSLVFIVLFKTEAQNRYYPSLTSLVALEEQRNLPKELQYFKDWYDASIKGVFYQDLQVNSNPRNSAYFKSLGLIFRQQKEFEFEKSGLKISFEPDPQRKVDPVRLTNNHYWNIMTYGLSIDLDTYDPEGDFYRFLILQHLQSMSEAQTLANFINTFTEPEENKTALEQFIDDVNVANDLNVVYDEDMRLAEVSNAINAQMAKGSNIYWAPYNTYINHEDQEKTRKRMQQFFRALNVSDIARTINDNVTPYGDFEFSKPQVKITLPKKHFRYVSKSNAEPVSFYVYKIDYDLNYNYRDKVYEFTLKLYPHSKSGTLEDYIFKCKYNDILDNGKEKVKRTEVKKDEIEYVEITFRPETWSIAVSTEMYRYIEFYKDFKVKK